MAVTVLNGAWLLLAGGNAGSRMHCTSCSCLPLLWPWAQIFLRRMGSASISLSGELPLPREPVRPLLWPKSTAGVARGSFHRGHLIYFILSNPQNNKWGYYYYPHLTDAETKTKKPKVTKLSAVELTELTSVSLHHLCCCSCSPRSLNPLLPCTLVTLNSLTRFPQTKGTINIICPCQVGLSCIHKDPVCTRRCHLI